MKHLKRFIRGLDTTKLGKFLQFVTVSDIMLCNHIYDSFTSLDDLQRRPVAHTCTFTLEIPCTYQSFPEFREQFNSILEANTWEMDIVENLMLKSHGCFFFYTLLKRFSAFHNQLE